MKRIIHEEIEALKNRILYMGGVAEEMINNSAKSCIERKEEFCQKVFEQEEEVNKLQIEIDETSVKIMALYQPEASDLRTIMAAMKINSELERIADQAVNISQTTLYHLLKEAPVETMELPEMAGIAKEMVKKSLDAFAKRNVDLAQEVLRRDEEMDLLKSKALNGIIGMISANPERSKQLIDMILIAKNFEKIGDHATNISEDVIFMALGKDIRHSSTS